MQAACSTFLPRIVGISNALELVYSAEILTTVRALLGLVRTVVSARTARHRVGAGPQVH